MAPCKKHLLPPLSSVESPEAFHQWYHRRFTETFDGREGRVFTLAMDQGGNEENLSVFSSTYLGV